MVFRLFITSLKYSFVWFCLQVNAQQSWDTLAIKNAIIRGDIKYLSTNLSLDNVNLEINDNTPPPLLLAINERQTKVVDFLLNHKKADPNLRYKSLSPLMYAVQTDGNKIIKALVKAGARLNDIDSIGNHILMIAALKQSPPIMRFLFRHGSSLNHRNFKGYTATDFANQANNKKTETLLKHLFIKYLPNYTDGPYIQYLQKHKLKITYLVHDSLKHRFIKRDYTSNINSYHPATHNILEEKNSFIQSCYKKEPSQYENVNKLLIIGDIHGQCDTLKKFLVVNHITDDQLQWNFGAGHVVILGDVLDRGEKVTEVLWLLYRLEQEAIQQGGKLHLLLGNHEIMILKGDTRYTADKYNTLTKNLSLQYPKLYSMKTVLGRWLRSKNTIVKINDLIFVHGGLHPVLIKENISLDSINSFVNNYLNSKIKGEKNQIPGYDLIFGDNGPFWFRGLITNHVIHEKDVDAILQFYGAARIFVGHTWLPKITNFYNGKVWGMDVPFYLYTGYPMEAIMINANEFYLLNTSGITTKIQIK